MVRQETLIAATRITRPISEPIRPNLTWAQMWKESDDGLIVCWETGREMSVQNPTLAAQAREGQLVMLPWKGGVEKVTKQKKKYGTLCYLATWQGLRGEDLDIDLDEERTLICTATGVKVVFTNDPKKTAEP